MGNKKHNREDLLSIGDQLFRKQGYKTTGTEEILTALDYPRSSFYYHFKSKEGFALQALDHYSKNIQGALMSKLQDKKVKSPTQRLENYFRMIAQYAKVSQYGSCCLVQRFSIESTPEDKALLESANSEYKKWVDIAIPCVQEAQNKNEMRQDLTADELCEFLFSSIYGGYTLGKISGDPSALEEKMIVAFKLIKK